MKLFKNHGQVHPHKATDDRAWIERSVHLSWEGEAYSVWLFRLPSYPWKRSYRTDTFCWFQRCLIMHGKKGFYFVEVECE